MFTHSPLKIVLSFIYPLLHMTYAI